MKVIYKYPLKIVESQQVELPVGSTILSVQMQYGVPCIWAMVESDAQKKMYTVNLYGTGQPIDCNNSHYIGTVQNAPFVWHLFVKYDGIDSGNPLMPKLY